MENSYEYQGSELELFSHAKNWKHYWSSYIESFVGDRVLEVGAGIGSNTRLINKGSTEWVCLEPDTQMASALSELQSKSSNMGTKVVRGCIADLPCKPTFDCIIYIDVLEHIEDDYAEVEAAKARLSSNGVLIVVSPAHQWLFSPFDSAVGHFRRYTSKSIRKLTPVGMEIVRVSQLDSMGILLSLANKWILKSDSPSRNSILFWDRVIVPISKVLDFVLGYRLGKTVVAVWRKESGLLGKTEQTRD